MAMICTKPSDDAARATSNSLASDELGFTPGKMVAGAGSLGGGEAGCGAFEISGSTSGLSLADAAGEKVGLHRGAALLGAFGVTGPGSSALVRFRLWLKDTTLAA